jgi:hypothetical protein
VAECFGRLMTRAHMTQVFATSALVTQAPDSGNGCEC